MMDYDKIWLKLTPDQRACAANAVREVLDEDTVDLIRRKHAEYGHDWIHHLIDIPADEAATAVEVGMLREGQTTMSAHHIWGTRMRNVLRHAAFPDKELPEVHWEHIQTDDGQPYMERNWDDYYVQAVEAAVGLRDV